MIDLSLIESPANPGIGIQFISGLVNHSQGNITKYDYKTESFIISLKVNTLQKSPNCNYPIIIAKKIKFINSPEEFNGKNSDFYSKMDLKFEDISIMLCEEYITHFYGFIDEEIKKLEIIIDYFGINTEISEFLHIKENKNILNKEKIGNKEKEEEVKEGVKIEGNKEKDEKSHLKTIKNQFNSFNLKDEGTFSIEAAVENQRELIRKHAFINSKFKENIVDKRCEALLDYNLSSSTSVDINHIKLVWIYKLSLKESSFNQNFGRNINLNSLYSQDFNEKNDQNNIFTKLTWNTELKEEFLQSLEGNLNDDSLNFVVESRNLFFGLQKWNLNNPDKGKIKKIQKVKNKTEEKKECRPFIQPHVIITKFELDYLRINMKLHSEIHPIITSVNTGRFMEFYLWNKRKSQIIQDPKDTKNNIGKNQKFIVTEKQKISLNIDHLNIS